MISELGAKAKQLLIDLINTPSFSGEEDQTASIIGNFLKDQGVPFKREMHNIWAVNKNFDVAKPNILLNSHHDTVRPNKAIQEIRIRLKRLMVRSMVWVQMMQVDALCH